MTKKQASAETPPSDGGAKVARHRSPNFPALNLEKAIERTRELYDTFKLTPIPERVVHEKWGYNAFGSQGYVIVAALKAFGLISLEGTGRQRRITVTESARRILLDSPDRSNLVKEAALLPQIYMELWQHFEGYLPKNDKDLRAFLVFQKRFNEKSVGRFISDFKDTISFANLDSGVILPRDEDRVERALPSILGHGILGGGLMTPLLQRRPEATQPPLTMEQIRDFTIPIKGQRVAILRVEVPITAEDVKRIKAWLDLLDTSEEEKGEGEK